jgi:hypothetical protein
VKDSLTDNIKHILLHKHTASVKDTTFQSRLTQLLDSTKARGNRFIDLHRKDYDILNDIKLRFQFSEIIYIDSVSTDTVLH